MNHPHPGRSHRRTILVRSLILIAWIIIPCGPTTVLSRLIADPPSATPVVISEFMAANTGSRLDADGASSDWIELWNPSDQPADLGGLFLTDDPDDLTRWPVPDASLEANGFLVVVASGKDRRDIREELHTNFRLNRTAGGFLALVHVSDGSPVTVAFAHADYPAQRDDVSFGLRRGSANGPGVYFKTPTLGTINSPQSVFGFVDSVRFSAHRGFMDEPFDLVLSTVTPGATLIYTLDGSTPTGSNGTRVPPNDEPSTPSVTLDISATTTVRALALRDGWEPTAVETNSYLFPADILRQNGRGTPFSNSENWGHAGPDWAHQNWYASFHRNSPAGQWRFHSWDAEKGLQNTRQDVTGRNDDGGPTNLHHDLIRKPEYRLRFADMASTAPRSPATARPGGRGRSSTGIREPPKPIRTVKP